MSFRIEINPELKMKSDIMFKAFYGRKENEEFLQDFLEAVLGEKLKIKKVMHDVRLEKMELNREKRLAERKAKKKAEKRDEKKVENKGKKKYETLRKIKAIRPI